MRHRLDLMFLLAAAFATGCGTPPRPQLAPAIPAGSTLLLGCWQLRSLDWEDTFLPGSLALRFDTTRATQHDSPLHTLHVETGDSTFRRRVRIAHWALYQGTDSLYAVVGDGFGGLEFRLAWRVDSLSGRAYRFTDAPHLRSSGKVLGRHQSC